MFKSLIIKCVIWLTSIAGCCIQLRTTFLVYFEYQTVTDISYPSIRNITIPALSLCTPYSDLLDYEELRKRKPDDWNKNPINISDRQEKHNQVQNVATIEDIFDLTPPESDLITGCHLHLESTRSFSLIHDKACYDHLSVKKFWTQEYICYKVLMNPTEVPYLNYVSGLDYPGELFRIILNKTIQEKMMHLKPIIHSRRTLATISKRYSRVHNRNDSKDNFYTISYNQHNILYLGYPFDSFTCTSNENLHRNCIEECGMTKSIEVLKKVLFDLDTTIEYKYRHVSISDIRNPITSRNIDDIIKKCDSKCNVKYCDPDYSMTRFSVSPDDDLTLIVMAPDSPFVHLRFTPALKLLDLIVYTMSALGAWFGVAFIHLEPLEVYQNFKRKFLGRSDKSEKKFKVVSPSARGFGQRRQWSRMDNVKQDDWMKKHSRLGKKSPENDDCR